MARTEEDRVVAKPVKVKKFNNFKRGKPRFRKEEDPGQKRLEKPDKYKNYLDDDDEEYDEDD